MLATNHSVEENTISSPTIIGILVLNTLRQPVRGKSRFQEMRLRRLRPKQPPGERPLSDRETRGSRPNPKQLISESLSGERVQLTGGPVAGFGRTSPERLTAADQ